MGNKSYTINLIILKLNCKVNDRKKGSVLTMGGGLFILKIALWTSNKQIKVNSLGKVIQWTSWSFRLSALLLNTFINDLDEKFKIQIMKSSGILHKNSRMNINTMQIPFCFLYILIPNPLMKLFCLQRCETANRNLAYGYRKRYFCWFQKEVK